MLSKAELMLEIGVIAAEKGLEVYDLNLPDRQAGLLQVFLCKKAGSAEQVSLDECAAVSRRLLAHEGLGEWLGGFTLEVSSPGINRRLQRPEHFMGALGERVQLTLKAGDFKGQVLVGKLAACDGREVVLEVEGTGRRISCGLDQISKARVDFLFA